MAKHSSIGASSASRWFECPGSIRLIAQVPPVESSIYAAEGTAAHGLAEKCLVEGIDPRDMIGETLVEGEFEFEVDEEMAEAIEVYIHEIAQGREMGPWKTIIEERVDLSRLHPELFGTADAIQFNLLDRKIRVIDFKYGKGFPVSAVNNKQALYYALGAIESLYLNQKEEDEGEIDDPLIFGWDHAFDEVEIVIVQPRARHIEGPVRRWIVPKGELNRFQDELLERAKETTKKDAVLKAGDHCRFCPALAVCPAQLQLINDQTVADFSPIAKREAPVLPPADQMTIEQTVGVLKYAGQISKWISAVEVHALSLLNSGVAVPGYKLVKKRSNRRWINEDQAREMLSMYLTDDEMLSPRTLLSPAKIEKPFKKKERDLFSQFIEQPDNGNTLADESDPRPAIEGGSVMSDFDEIEN